MRMFSHNPAFLCRTHLLAEHQELHMMGGCVIKGYHKTLSGLCRTGKCCVHDLKRRHDVVEAEMVRRGMKPVAPYPDVEGKLWVEGHVLPAETLVTLFVRCPGCRERTPMEAFHLCRKAITPEIVARIIRDEEARRIEGKSLRADLSLLEVTT